MDASLPPHTFLTGDPAGWNLAEYEEAKCHLRKLRQDGVKEDNAYLLELVRRIGRYHRACFEAYAVTLFPMYC